MRLIARRHCPSDLFLPAMELARRDVVREPGKAFQMSRQVFAFKLGVNPSLAVRGESAQRAVRWAFPGMVGS
jgi:hypothetical protein